MLLHITGEYNSQQLIECIYLPTILMSRNDSASNPPQNQYIKKNVMTVAPALRALNAM